jgi:excisionase family DNA binding protein
MVTYHGCKKNVLDPDEITAAQMAHLRKHLPQVLKLAESGRGFLRVEREGKRETVSLPSSYLRAFARALAEVAKGRRVAIEPEKQELTPGEAADFLNVSRPYLTRLLEERKIPHRNVGTHWRVRLRDLRAYREQMRVEAEDALQQLTDHAQEFGIGYEEE